MLKKIRKILTIVLIIIIFLIIAFKLYSIILKRLYPKTYSEYVYRYAEKYEVDSAWVFALIKTESNFNPESISSSGAIGLMQLMEKTALEVAKEIGMEDMNLKNVEDNIELGTKYFASLIDYYDENYYLAIAAYNAGIGNVGKWINDGVIKEDGSDIENIPYKETNNYVRKVLKNYRVYNELYK